jgi:hypothetical protein
MLGKPIQVYFCSFVLICSSDDRIAAQHRGNAFKEGRGGENQAANGGFGKERKRGMYTKKKMTDQKGNDRRMAKRPQNEKDQGVQIRSVELRHRHEEL